ncbi:phage antirepressor KilAC domain-containing protein [Corynebacterium kefirresidentii]|uniref:phage antirepressor KilAC domain-containing protein n=1 Tax=Corynebacterium kefirresidentii TaxID=1979527 RepID=UPI0020063E38|nr:phage antirepressor KilAC domain-containing protein [Corynebacterium kefirresidentii]
MGNSPMPANTGANDNVVIPLTDHDGTQAVMGRDLHAFLEVSERYTQWFARMEEYGFNAGQDFIRETGKSTGGRPSVNHIISLDMAKEISMIQRTDKGKQARQYFIECERRAKQPTINGAELTRMELIQIAMNAETERLQLEAKNKELEPKADAYDEFIDATGKYNIGTVAKMFGKGQNWLFRELRNAGVLISKGAMRNTPYQQYMHHFEVKAHSFERSNGTQGVSYTTYVQPSGIQFIQRKLNLSSIDPMLPEVA